MTTQLSSNLRIWALASCALFAVNESTLAAPQMPTDPGIHWSVTGDLEYQSNVFRSTNNAQSDVALGIKPTAVWIGELEASRFNLGYRGNYAQYNDFSDENYNDHTFSGKYDYALSERLLIGVDGSYELAHEGRGASGSAANIAKDLVEMDTTTLGARLSFGRRVARAQINLNIKQSQLRFDDGERLDGTPIISSLRDRDVTSLGSNIYYRIMPKTWIIADLQYSDTEYQRLSILDSSETKLLIGAAWEGTAKTSGEVRIGYLKKNFSTNLIEDFGGFTVEGDLTWEPKEFSRVILSLGRSTQESGDLNSDFFVTNRMSITWQHELTSRISFSVAALAQNDEFQQTARSDDFLQGNLSASYRLKRWLELGANYSYQERDSNVALNYDNHTVGISVTVTPGAT